MATKFVAPVITLALLVFTFSVGKPLREKGLFSWRKNLHQYSIIFFADLNLRHFSLLTAECFSSKSNDSNEKGMVIYFEY